MLTLTLLLLSAAPKTVAVTPAPAPTEVEKLRAEVASLRERLEKIEKRFADEDEARAIKAANAATVRATLDAVTKQLVSGDTRNADAQLRDIEKLAEGDTLKFIAAARAALKQNDLANARGALMLALASVGL
jgi:hypothetical protein